MSNQPIGILDSGVGGLSIWREIVKELPNESTLYFADSKNCPYGEKSQEEVYKLTKRIIEFLVKKGSKLVIIACNTATVSCLDKLRQDFKDLPIVGTVPVVKTAAISSKNKKIGVLSTSLTSNSEYQKNLINAFANGCEVVNIGTDNLVPFIERGEIDSPILKEALQESLKPFKKAKIDALALGCSHFPFLKKEILDILGTNVQVLDSGPAIARQVKRVLVQNNDLSFKANPNQIFYTTGDEAQFKSTIKKLLGDKLPDDIISTRL
ncbi:MAG: glutamate racemase [Patescibacteria group bacterium]|nr:glutamate racemase [Patescibacteria group bacterium]